MTIWPRDVWYTSLYCSLFSSCDVLFGVFVLPLVCHGNWVRSFLITYFFSPFLLPCNWTQSPGKYGLSPKDINVSAKVSFSEPMEEWGKKKGRKKSYLIATFCDFHQAWKVDISQTIWAIAKAALQERVLEEAYRDHLSSPLPLQLFLGWP